MVEQCSAALFTVHCLKIKPKNMADCRDEFMCSALLWLETAGTKYSSKVQVGATADESEFEFQIWMNLFGG